MRLRPTLCLALLSPFLAAADQPAALIWHFDQPALVGGQQTEVLGAPRVVTEPAGPAVWFDGAGDGLVVPLNPLAGAPAFTIQVLFHPAADGPEAPRFLHLQDDTGSRALIEIRLADGTWALDTFLSSTTNKARLVLLDPTKRHPADRWTWVALVYDGEHMRSYINGVQELAGEVAFPPTGPGRVSLGVRQNKIHWFKGGIREVRWHTTALKATELQSTPPGRLP